MADQTMPDPPVFRLCKDDMVNLGPGGTLPDTEGRRWTRIVYGTGGVCAAEDVDGTLWVWDQQELFEAVFRAGQVT